MKQILLSPRSGELEIAEVPVPRVRAGMVLVHNAVSVVSSGTERQVLDLAGKSLIGKARARPDLVRDVVSKIRRDGLQTTIRESLSRLESPHPLGYSSAGSVLDVGAEVTDLKRGDRVACAGAGWAAHAEVVVVPRPLCAQLPPGVSVEAGAFGMLGAIALHGTRRAGVGLGDVVVVLGLGIVGQLMVQLLRAAGCRVVAYDLMPARVTLANTLGTDHAVATADELGAAVLHVTAGIGADAVIVAASTESSTPLELAADLARPRGTVVMVGTTGMQVPRRAFWEKELTLRLSKASGPGSEEEEYERRGRDYPAPYVRWTAGRNMAAFLDEVARGAVRVDPLITHRFPIERASEAYELIRGNTPEHHLGVLLTYSDRPPVGHTLVLRKPAATQKAGNLRIGVIGGGLFAQTVLLPALREVPGVGFRSIATATGASSRHVADRQGFEICTTDYREVLDDPDVDAVVIATRNDQHAALAAAALRSGKSVFVEKPLALTPGDVRAVVAAYQAAPRVLTVGFNRRYSPLVRDVKRFVAGGRPLVLTYRVNAGSIPADHWVYDPIEGGGRWLGEGGHFVDLLQYLTDADPVEVFTHRIALPGTAGESVVVSLRFGDGSAATIAYVDGADRAASRERLEVFGQGLTCTIEDFQHAVLARAGRVRRIRRWEAARGYREELTAWVRAARGEAPAPVAIETYTANAACCFAVLESARTGTPVAVDVAAVMPEAGANEREKR